MATGVHEGLELKTARLRPGIKQYELAARVGIGATQLSELEQGRHPLTPELREKIKKVLDEVRTEHKHLGNA